MNNEEREAARLAKRYPSLAPKAPPAAPADATPEQARLAKRYPSLAGAQTAPPAPPRYPEGLSPKRIESRYPSIYGNGDQARAATENMVNTRSPLYHRFVKWAEDHGLAEQQRLELVQIGTSVPGAPPFDAWASQNGLNRHQREELHRMAASEDL